jgi:hypothetical protein
VAADKAGIYSTYNVFYYREDSQINRQVGVEEVLKVMGL